MTKTRFKDYKAKLQMKAAAAEGRELVLPVAKEVVKTEGEDEDSADEFTARASDPPVVKELKRTRRGNHIRIKAHLLNETNQGLIKKYIDAQGPLNIFDVQGAIGMAGLRRFSGVLCANVDTLRRVSLRANNLRLPAVLDIVAALKLPQNNTLELLDLSSNPIGSDGYKVLMQKVLLNTSVSALLVSRCNIGDQGVEDSQQYLGGKVRPVSGRFYVNLSLNAIGPAGHSVIASSLPTWMSVSLTRQRPPVLHASPVVAPQAAPPVDVEGLDDDDEESCESESSSEEEEEGEDEGEDEATSSSDSDEDEESDEGVDEDAAAPADAEDVAESSEEEEEEVAVPAVVASKVKQASSSAVKKPAVRRVIRKRVVKKKAAGTTRIG
eukprot:Rhum_TRINITY_DN2886_c0_g3::Rhum_TRINITY_DN2886_c0_g3_i1::g.8725::m.8725